MHAQGGLMLNTAKRIGGNYYDQQDPIMTGRASAHLQMVRPMLIAGWSDAVDKPIS